MSSVLRIHDILVRILIHGSMPLTNGSWFGSGSCPSEQAAIEFRDIFAEGKVPYLYHPPYTLKQGVMSSVLRIHDILVRILIHGSIPLTNGSWFGSGSFPSEQAAIEFRDIFAEGKVPGYCTFTHHVPVLRIRFREDPHHFDNLDPHPDPHPIKIRIQ